MVTAQGSVRAQDELEYYLNVIKKIYNSVLGEGLTIDSIINYYSAKKGYFREKACRETDPKTIERHKRKSGSADKMFSNLASELEL